MRIYCFTVWVVMGAQFDREEPPRKNELRAPFHASNRQYQSLKSSPNWQSSGEARSPSITTVRVIHGDKTTLRRNQGAAARMATDHRAIDKAAPQHSRGGGEKVT